MRALAIFCASILLTACATTNDLTTAVVSKDVNVPVTEKCVAPEDIPEIPKTAAQPEGNIEQDAAAASADARDYRRKLRTAIVLLKKCVTNP